MRGGTGGIAAVAAAGHLLLGPAAGKAEGQEPREAPPAVQDTAAPPGATPPDARPRRTGCPLVLETAARLDRIQRGGAFVYHIGGGMLWRCGNAEMEADSAVRYEAARRVEMMRNVDYRDTIRTLTSDFLTYYELPDLVIATGDVHLTRLSTGSTLEGPRVEFLRAVSGRDELTTATGRPHLTLYPSGERDRPPFAVDADVVELAGEEMARARVDVVIRRPDLLARADSAVFDIVEGGGVLYGAPEVEGRGFRLSGDTVRLRFEDEDLREVWARGRAYAAGESFEVVGEEIRARIEEEKAREVWAFGAERSLAIAVPYRVYGDSLRFVLTDGRIDSVTAVGGAIAVEAPEESAAATAETDTAAAVAAPPPPAAGDTAAGEAADVAPPSPAAARDTAARADTAAVAAPNEGAGVPIGVAGPGDSVPPPKDTTTVAAGAPAATRDTAAVRRVRDARPDPPPEPRLGVEGTGSWMAGDTLFALFEPAPGDSLTEEGRTGDPEPESGGEEPEPDDPEPAAVAPDEPAAAEDAGRRLERIRVVSVDGTARAFYAAVMDSSRTAVPSRNYIIGREILILFREGRVFQVHGQDAIGVYLDPLEEGDAPPDAAGAPPDTAGAPPDTTGAPPDTTGAPPDKMDAPPDATGTAAGRQGSTARRRRATRPVGGRR